MFGIEHQCKTIKTVALLCLKQRARERHKEDKLVHLCHHEDLSNIRQDSIKKLNRKSSI